MPNSMSTKPGFYEESPTTESSGSNNNENLNTDISNMKDDKITDALNNKTKNKDAKNAGGR